MDGFLVRTGLLIHLIFLSTCGFEPLEISPADYESKMKNPLLETDGFSEMRRLHQKFFLENGHRAHNYYSNSFLFSRGNYNFYREETYESSSSIPEENLVIETSLFKKPMRFEIPFTKFSVIWNDCNGAEKKLSVQSFLALNKCLYAFIALYFSRVDNINPDWFLESIRCELFKKSDRGFILSDAVASFIETFHLEKKYFGYSPYQVYEELMRACCQEIIITDHRENNEFKRSAFLYLGAMSFAGRAGWDAEKHSQEDFYPKQTLKNGPFTFGMPPLL